MQVLPDVGQNRNNEGAKALGPTLDFKVQITTLGEYRLWLGSGSHDGGSDSLYAEIVELRSDAGGPGPNWYRQAPPIDDADFLTAPVIDRWDGDGTPDAVNAGGGEVPMTWNITKAGVYTVRI